MAKKLTLDDWDRIQREAPSRYFVQSVEDGKLRVEFISEIVCVERGDEDILGNVWTREWPKNEAKVYVNGEPKVYSLGGSSWSFIRDFILVCKKHNLKPEDIPGSVFEIEKTGDWTQNIKYLGRASNLQPSPPKEIKLNDSTMRDIKDTIKDLKTNSPELLEGGISKLDFLKMIRIRGKVKTTDTEAMLPTLIKDGILKMENDKIFIL